MPVASSNLVTFLFVCCKKLCVDQSSMPSIYHRAITYEYSLNTVDLYLLKVIIWSYLGSGVSNVAAHSPQISAYRVDTVTMLARFFAQPLWLLRISFPSLYRPTLSLWTAPGGPSVTMLGNFRGYPCSVVCTRFQKPNQSFPAVLWSTIPPSLYLRSWASGSKNWRPLCCRRILRAILHNGLRKTGSVLGMYWILRCRSICMPYHRYVC